MTAPTLLVVDDEPELREALVEYFTACGFLVTAVHTAGEALSSLSPDPSAVLTDLNLPDARGESLLVRLIDRFPHSLLYVHSGDARFHLSEPLLRAGLTSDHVFIKPSKLSDMASRIRSDLAKL